MIRASGGWPWWTVPAFLLFRLVHFISYPVAVLPFHATCHEDLWGTPPAQECLSYWCAQAREWHTEENWPQCAQWWEEHP